METKNFDYIKNNIASIKSKIEEVKKLNNIKYNIDIVAVTKTFSAFEAFEAYKYGINIFGENKVQEAIQKIDEFKKIYNSNLNLLIEKDVYSQNEDNINFPFKWYMIGKLQTNKVKKAIEYFDGIQSIDREELVNEIIKRLEINDDKEQNLKKIDKKIEILFEVNISHEPQKSGVFPEDLFKLIEYTLNKKCRNLIIKGLMTIGSFTDNIDVKNREFEEMKKLFERSRELFGKELFEILSMGMSNDYDIAIKHGANMVRIGTSIFGKRNY